MATDEELRAEATRRVSARRWFYIHLAIYIVVNAGLFVQWWAISPDAGYWPLTTTLGWGLGVAFHGIAVMLGTRTTDEAKIEREMARMRGGTSGPAPTA